MTVIPIISHYILESSKGKALKLNNPQHDYHEYYFEGPFHSVTIPNKEYVKDWIEIDCDCGCGLFIGATSLDI